MWKWKWLKREMIKLDIYIYRYILLDIYLSILGNGEQFKITFVIAHRIADRILQIVERIVESNQIAIHLYSLAMNPNTDKPIDI